MANSSSGDARTGEAATGTDATHPDVPAEQAYLDHAYRCLAAMQGRAEHITEMPSPLAVGDGDRFAWQAHTERRLRELADSPAALCFGRLDRADGERWYVGRRHVEDADSEPVVADWRAPVAIPFYRATVADPMGLRVRRRFLVEGRRLVDLFDEDLTDPDASHATYVPDPLLAELERSRTGEMRDIVATIQAEQDVIIRAPLDDCVVVQGGPGTGKTAVGLHRAAFLLYTHREALEHERLLIVGPNRVFLRYISQVLPSLGETASFQTTVEGLAGTRFRLRGGQDRPEVARLKGDARMAAVIRRVVLDRVGPPSDDLVVATSFGSVTLPAGQVAPLVEDVAAATGRPTNAGREVLRERLLALAWRRHLERPASDPAHHAGFTAEVRADRGFKRLVDRSWPTATATAVVRRLLGNRRARASACRGVLGADEQELLARTPTRRVADEPWTRADLGLLDEADAVTSGVTITFGHVVVDEAQDLSAMELRMIARRSPTRSLTVLGDLAQATSPTAQTSWDDALEHLLAPSARVAELELGYRVPEPILAFANRLLPHAAPHVRPARSVRVRGEAPRIVEAHPGQRWEVAAAEVAALAGDWATVAAVAPERALDDLARALTDAGVEFADARRGGQLGDHVTLLGPTATKGLELDAVVVAEPGTIAVEEAAGLRTLYVVLTRAVHRLTLVHADGLPAPLA